MSPYADPGEAYVNHAGDGRTSGEILPDLHHEKKDLVLTKAGIKGLTIPMCVGDYGAFVEFSAYVTQLETRGANMSRFARTLNKYIQANLDGSTLHAMAEELADAHNGECTLKARTKLALWQPAPVSNERALSIYNIRLAIDTTELEFVYGFDIPISTVCPCSAEMTKIAGHMQRAILSVDLKIADATECHIVLMQDILQACELQGSGILYNVLKREDEKALTLAMIGNPKFVEDVTRDVAEALKAFSDDVESCSIVVRSQESIHQYDVLGIYDSDGTNWKSF